MKGVSIYRMPRGEQVYTFKYDKTGEIFHFAVDQMNAFIRSCGLEVGEVLIHKELIVHLVQRGGWEEDHLAKLPLEALKSPCTLIDYGDGTHVLADGVHRVLKHVQLGLVAFPAYLVPERIWRRFLIYDFPEHIVDWDDFLINGDRHMGLTPKTRKKVSW